MRDASTAPWHLHQACVCATLLTTTALPTMTRPDITGHDWLRLASDWHILSLCSVVSVKTVWLGRAQPLSMFTCHPDYCLRSLSTLDFLLLLSHGCRHPVDRTFACRVSPILCALWRGLVAGEIETGLNSRTLAALSSAQPCYLRSVAVQFVMAIEACYLAISAGRCVFL
jgi:hypothetical protein